jgi:GTPase
MKRIKLALVGRPNVGKSALFNRISKKNISIVHEEEGITRDRLYSAAEFFGKPFEVIDTAGIDLYSNNIFNDEVLFQTKIAIGEADVIVMVVDAKTGPTKLDEEVAGLLFKVKKPILLAINKVDNPEEEERFIKKFVTLGIKDLLAVSATQGYHIAELLEIAFKDVTWEEKEAAEENPIDKIAFIGRTNVGKSTLLNYLLNEKRSVVSPIAGTTRDSIDALVTFKNKSYIFIDTAGVRRRHKEPEAVDKFARIRTEKAIKRADLGVLIIDANEGFTTQDRKIAAELEEEKKSYIILANKWDQVKGFRMEHCRRAIREESHFTTNYPIIFASAKTGRNIDLLFVEIEKVLANQRRKIATSMLNKFIERSMQKYHPPMIKGRRLRVYYLTQKEISPPRFVLFINHKELMTKTYLRYLTNQLRENFDFSGVSLFLELKDKSIYENPYVSLDEE